MNNVNKRDQMDLTNIETVSDLVNANKGPDIKSIVEGVFELTNTQSFKLMHKMLQTHLDFHHAMIEKLEEDGDIGNIAIWERDATLLEVALNCVNQVTV